MSKIKEHYNDEIIAASRDKVVDESGMKCITFDTEAQYNLPEHIKAKMKADRERAKIEYRINKLEDEIYVLNMHLKHEENPSRYSVPKPSEQRAEDITWLKNRIAEKTRELEELKIENSKSNE